MGGRSASSTNAAKTDLVKLKASHKLLDDLCRKIHDGALEKHLLVEVEICVAKATMRIGGSSTTAWLLNARGHVAGGK